MKNLNWGLMLTRLYYVGWAGCVVLGVAAASEKWETDPFPSAIFLLSFLVGPWLLLSVIQWVLAGLYEDKSVK